jgi:hypothetical protein
MKVFRVVVVIAAVVAAASSVLVLSMLPEFRLLFGPGVAQALTVMAWAAIVLAVVAPFTLRGRRP